MFSELLFSVSLSFFSLFYRDNFLVLDIFFEALNYETIEQKKAYDVAGLLGKKSSLLKLIYKLSFQNWSSIL